MKSNKIGEALFAIAKGVGADQRDALIRLQDEILVKISQSARDDLLADVNRTPNLDALNLRP